MTTTTITRSTQVYDLSDEYKLVEEFTLTATPSTDETVTKMKELLIKLTEERVIGNTEGNAWGSLLLDMVCLKAANRSNWEQPIAHLLPVLKRLGSEAQVEQALTEFAADNAPTFTTIEEFQWGRVGGLYWEPHYWWGFLKQYSTPELKKAFFEKMDEFCSEWEPTTPELEEEFAEVDVAAAHIAAVKEARQRAEERLKACTPVQVGMTREEYLAAYQASLSGETDVTGVMAAIKQLNMPEQSERKLKYYIQQRIESPTSPVGQKLIAATEGENVIELVTGLFQSGRYNGVRLPEEPEVIETEDEDKELTPQELFEQCDEESNYEPLFADAARCEDVIKANIETIALNYTEENEYAATGEEPQWLLSALLKAGAEFGSGGGGDDDEDEDEEQPDQKNAYDVPNNYGGTQIMDCIIKYGMSYEWVINWLNDWCAEKLKEEGDGITLINLPAGSVSYFSVATLLSENETSSYEEDIRFNNELIERIQQHDSASGYLVMLVVRPEESEFHVVPHVAGNKDEDEDVDKPVAKTVPSAQTTNLLNMQQDALDKYKKRAEEEEFKKQVETEVIDFKGKRICVTGKLSNTRSEIEQLIKDMGGTVASGVSKTTDYLIAGSDAGSKLTKAQELGIPVLSETQADRVFNEDEPPLTIGGLDETTRWGNGWDGIWYKGNYYVAERSDHEVYVTVNKEYWEKEFKGKEAHTVGINGFSEATWCIDFGCSDFVSEVLCEELFGEDGPFDWYEMTEEQQELIAKTSLERGEYKYMRHLGITSDYSLSEYCENLPDEAYAEVLGLDPKHTEVSMQG